MTISPEILAAYADGELGAAERHEIEAALATDPALRAQLEAHRALKARLAGIFAPVAAEPVPARLREALRATAPGANVIDFARAADRKRRPALTSPWIRFGGPALAASLVLALVGLNRGTSVGYADGQLGQALDNQLAATQPADGPVRILLSFRDHQGTYCRGYAEGGRAGIACREAQGWRLREEIADKASRTGEFRQAGSGEARVMEAIQDMADGPALDDREERMARSALWRAGR